MNPLSGFAMVCALAVLADTEDKLAKLNPQVFSKDDAKLHGQALNRDQKVRLRAAAIRETAEWDKVQSKADWEKFRDTRLEKLRATLGTFPGPFEKNHKPAVEVTNTLDQDGYKIDTILYESRSGFWVTADLYRPEKPPASAPAIIVSHSHHTSKTNSELQEMGGTWARSGCYVLVPDHVGHGERRQHPFHTANDFPQPFRTSRQDYYFRAINGEQLDLAGESLIGWMAWDLSRGLDVLLSQPNADPNRAIVLGAVAGGGDPAALVAALDSRFTCAIPFNFGGTQPDYTTPADPADFYWFNHPYWETTRCLRGGADGGYAAWVIVSSLAPRRLILGHEFAWDRAKDPAFSRIEKVFGFYDPKRLAIATGQGNLKGQPPESSHCTHVGALHRSKLYPVLKDWFDMPVPKEHSQNRPSNELLATTHRAVVERKPRTLQSAVLTLVDEKQAKLNKELDALPDSDRGKAIQQQWAKVLGQQPPRPEPIATIVSSEKLDENTIEKISLDVGNGFVLPVMLLLPPMRDAPPRPIVLGLAHGGKAGFLKYRAKELQELLLAGHAICLPDLRGTGELASGGDSRRYNGSGSTLAAAEHLLGNTLLGARLDDCRSVLKYLKTRPELDSAKLKVWGTSFADANPIEKPFAVPLDVDLSPSFAEPLGGILALFLALEHPDRVKAVAIEGGLIDFRTALRFPFCYVPNDCLPPNGLTAADLPRVAQSLRCPLKVCRVVNSLNYIQTPATVKYAYPEANTSETLVGKWLSDK